MASPANDRLAIDTSDLHGAEVVDEVLSIPTARIKIGERLRAVDPVWADALGRMMARSGQDTAVEVCRLPGDRDWTLVSGGHRLRGALLHDIEHLRCIVVSANRDDRRLREVNENLWRKDLDPIDRAAFIAEFVAIKKRRVAPADDAARTARVKRTLRDAVHAEADGMMEIISMTYGWSDEVGEQLGFTGRTVRNDLFLYRRLTPSLVAKLREARHPVASNATQLRALAKLDDATQARAVDMLLDGRARTVGDAAKAISGKPVPDAETKRFSAILGTLHRMSASERLGLFQSPEFHRAIPIAAQRLLEPMLRGGGAA